MILVETTSYYDIFGVYEVRSNTMESRQTDREREGGVGGGGICESDEERIKDNE